MALLFFGKTVCPLCARIIRDGESVFSFSPFVLDESDPCFFFSDKAFHLKCVEGNQIGGEAIQRFEEWKSKTGPGKRKCSVCELEITDPDNYLLIESLSVDSANALYGFNYTHLHKSCISNWPMKKAFVLAGKSAIESGQWKGSYLPYLVKQIDAAR